MFLAKIEVLRSMLLWICDGLIAMNVDLATLRKIELASEEALINIIQHAYQGRPGKIEIEMNLYPDCRVAIAFKDSGPPFDPSKYAIKKDQPSHLEEREIGGLGIHLIRENMDEVHYARDHNRNVLLLIKKIKT